MRLVMLYHPESEFARSVEEYAQDFEKVKNRTLELVSLETKEGADMAKLYDIVEYPSLLVVDEASQLIKNWQGMPLPIKDEVAGYAGQEFIPK